MITVDEVFPFDIRASIGPAGTIKRLFQNREFFRERGYEMTIFANHFARAIGILNFYELREMIELPNQLSYSKTKGGGRKKKIVSALKKWAHDTKWIGYLFLRYKENRVIGKLVQTYIDRGRRPNIVVFHGFEDCDYYLKHRHEDDKAKVVVFLHSDGRDISMTYNNYPKLVGTKLMKQVYESYINAINKSDRVVYISKLAKRAFLEIHPDFDKTKIYTAVNGIDNKPQIEVSPSCDAKFRICTSGTVNKRKGQYIIVEAMKRMNPDILKDTHLTIMGLGSDYARLVNDVATSGLKDNVTFLGNVPNPEMHEKLSSENIYCLMSNNEGLPIAILEAMRAGLPVISTKIAGIPEQVDESNGLLIEPDIDQLVSVLNHLYDYDWGEMGRASRKKFEEEFTFQRMLNDYASIFDSFGFE